jgi:hypothetical protein
MLYRTTAPEPRGDFRELALVFAVVALGIAITLWIG